MSEDFASGFGEFEASGDKAQWISNVDGTGSANLKIRSLTNPPVIQTVIFLQKMMFLEVHFDYLVKRMVPNDQIRLQYSLNGGTDWTDIANLTCGKDITVGDFGVWKSSTAASFSVPDGSLGTMIRFTGTTSTVAGQTEFDIKAISVRGSKYAFSLFVI